VSQQERFSATLQEILQRLARMEERVAIEELTALYAWHAANADTEALASLFTEDGVFINEGDGEGPQKNGPQLIGYYNARQAPGYAVPLVSNHIIQIDGEEASCVCKMHTPWFHQDRQGFCGFYRDRLRKVDGKWRFAERRWTFHAPPSPP
jgi:hypothetical protein